jgi:hypothetical protein
MIDLYVYYKVREADAPALAPRVRALQARVGAQAQLKRRPDAGSGLQTWMEVYPGVDDDFPARLDAAAQGAGFEGLIDGPRRAEIFMDLPPCA